MTKHFSDGGELAGVRSTDALLSGALPEVRKRVSSRTGRSCQVARPGRCDHELTSAHKKQRVLSPPPSFRPSRRPSLPTIPVSARSLIRSILPFVLEVEVTGTTASQVHVVATASQLTAALNAAVNDEAIVLSSGQYGNYTISGRNFGSYVTLRSQQPKGAVFQSLTVLNSSRLRIDGVRVSSPNNGSPASKVARIENCHHIEFLNCEVHGLVDDNYSGHYGLYLMSCQDIVLRGNYVHDVHNGITLFSTRG